MNSLKRVVAVLSIVSMVAVVAPVAQAVTAEELAAQIAALQAQLNQLLAQYQQLTGTSAGVPAACVGVTFTRNLSLGASGSDVKCLQAILNQSADTQVAASGAGSPGNETTYFGSLTQAAVVKFQTKNAISPAAGYVGPITRAKLNDILSAGGVTPTTPTTPTTGAEGSISATVSASPITGGTVYAGGTGVAIMGIDVKATGSDVKVNRLDVRFHYQTLALCFSYYCS